MNANNWFKSLAPLAAEPIGSEYLIFSALVESDLHIFLNVDV